MSTRQLGFGFENVWLFSKWMLILVSALVTGVLSGSASAAEPTIQEWDEIWQPDLIRIACVGDSITAGHLDPANAWPVLLGRLADQHARGVYEVGNFGRNGATLLPGTEIVYHSQSEYGASLEFEPDVVIINLGINDAHMGNWFGEPSVFAAGLEELIDVYEALPSKPVVWLSHLTMMYPAFPFWEGSIEKCGVVNNAVDAVAAKRGLGVIDFRRATAQKPALFADGLHPNRSGNWLMAKAAFDAMKGSSIVAVDREEVVLVEAESFSELGGWVNDSQFMDLMGSPFLLAHGIGVPVADAHTQVQFPSEGTYRVGFARGIGSRLGGQKARQDVFKFGSMESRWRRPLEPKALNGIGRMAEWSKWKSKRRSPCKI